jgi:hypothetical protein
MYYYENLVPTGIAACLGLIECEIEQVRLETLGLLRTLLAAQIGVPELPASFDNDADGADVLVNGYESLLTRRFPPRS